MATDPPVGLLHFDQGVTCVTVKCVGSDPPVPAMLTGFMYPTESPGAESQQGEGSVGGYMSFGMLTLRIFPDFIVKVTSTGYSRVVHQTS